MGAEPVSDDRRRQLPEQAETPVNFGEFARQRQLTRLHPAAGRTLRRRASAAFPAALRGQVAAENWQHDFVSDVCQQINARLREEQRCAF